MLIIVKEDVLQLHSQCFRAVESKYMINWIDFFFLYFESIFWLTKAAVLHCFRKGNSSVGPIDSGMAPSAGLPMTPSRVVWVTLWREGCHPWTDWRGGCIGTSWSSKRASVRSYTWVEAIPSENTDWIKGEWIGSRSQRRAWGCWWMWSST